MLLDDIEHLPKVVTDVVGIKDVLLAIEPEIIQLREDISDLIKELYVKTTEDFITRWEKDFSLKYDASLTLAQRRQRILNKLARKRPLTWDNLKLLIKNNLADKVQFYLSNDSANYHFRIIINPEMEEVFDPSKFTVVGSPTITDDGVASGFSGSNRLYSILSLSANNFKVTGQFKTPSTLVSENKRIYKFLPNTVNMMCLDGSNLRIWLGNTSTWSVEGVIVANNITANTSYNYEVEYNNNTLTVKLNNSVVYLNTVTVVLPTLTSIYIGSDAGTPENYFTGSIDLKQFSITVDGVKVFSGTKTVPKGISEMEKAVRQAKPAYLTFDIIVTDIVRRCGTFNCGTNPL